MHAACWLPALADPDMTVVLERHGEQAAAPALAPADVAVLCEALRSARHRIVALPSARIIDAIAEAARRLRDPGAPHYPDLIRGLAAFTGYAPPMAALVLDRMAEDWSAPALHALLNAEFGGAAAVDGFVPRAPGVVSRAVGPVLSFHVFAGNVPGVSVTSIVRALLVRSAVLGKTAAGEPLLAPLFARLLADVDPDIGACIAVTYWPGGAADLEQAVLDHADLVVHYGGAAAIRSLRQRAPERVRFLEHGPRLSLALVRADAAAGAGAEAIAADLARATALFDQQGCVSPQVAWVVGADATAAAAFAAAVAAALDALHRDLPRGRIDAAEAAAIRAARTTAEFAAIRGEPVQLWTGAALAWTVIAERDVAFHGSCLNRTLFVKPAASLEQVLDSLRPHAAILQTVGTAGWDGADLLALAARLGEAGATRVTTVAAMPWPPPAWHHDGRGPLRELVRWMDLES